VFGDAAAYERFMGRWSAALAPRFLDVALGAGAPATVCDVGCGTGNLSAELLHRDPGCRVTGVDPSPAFVDAAQARLGGPGARFVTGSADRLPLGDGEADAALALLVLNFVPDPDAAVAEMRRVTRPGGALAAAVWDYRSGMAMLRVFWDAAAAVREGAVDEALDRPAASGGLGALLDRGGLDDVSEGVVAVPMHFASFDDYWEPFLLGTGPAGAYVAALSDDERTAVRDELERRLGTSAFDLESTARWARGTVPA
jgi:SAM-dependent methyltransferase